MREIPLVVVVAAEVLREEVELLAMVAAARYTGRRHPRHHRGDR